MDTIIRHSVIAGSWYPGDPEELRQAITTYLEQADVPAADMVPIALVSPHAGYVYSGPVAACAYKMIVGADIDTVVVISPSHRAYFPHISVWGSGGYETPLGVVPVNEEFCSQLVSGSSAIREDKRPHLMEHALEIQLPFLQVALGEFSLCPIMMGDQELTVCQDLGDALAVVIDDPVRTLVVASSDLSHFHHADQARVMDGRLAEAIEQFDIESLSALLASGEGEACGGGPILAAMVYAKARGKGRAGILKYANSGDITGDTTSVVGYLAAMFS